MSRGRPRRVNGGRFVRRSSPSDDPSARLYGLPRGFWMAGEQYQTLRSVSENHVFVVCRDGTFYELVPEAVRKQGPWQGMHRGEIEKLKPEYRLALTRD